MPAEVMSRSDIRTEQFHAWIRPDGFEEIAWAPGVTIDATVARAAADAGREVAGGQRRRLIIDMRTSGVMNREARAIFAGEEGWVHGVALLVQSPLSRVVANFFLGVSNAGEVTRMFTSEADAIAWLVTKAR